MHQSVAPAQDYAPDIAICAISLVGAAALADKLGIPKAMLFMGGQHAPVGGQLYGSGASLISTVPQWTTLLPRQMVSIYSLTNAAHKVVS